MGHSGLALSIYHLVWAEQYRAWGLHLIYLRADHASQREKHQFNSYKIWFGSVVKLTPSVTSYQTPGRTLILIKLFLVLLALPERSEQEHTQFWVDLFQVVWHMFPFPKTMTLKKSIIRCGRHSTLQIQRVKTDYDYVISTYVTHKRLNSQIHK
jgi:hypothetical protein